MPRVIRFMHVPKTGGNTLRSIFARQYGEERIFWFSGDIERDRAEYAALSRLQRESITVFLGHAALRTGIEAADGAEVFTLLRDPVRRVMSFCQHASEGKSEYLLERFPPATFRLDELLWSGDGNLTNQQTKMLLGDGSITAESPIRELSFEEARGRAIERLFDEVSFYGLQERFDESLLLFASRLGWTTPWYARQNAGNPYRRLRFEPHHVERIRELNRLDLAVYEAAKARFEQMLPEEIRASARRFRWANAAVADPLRRWATLKEHAGYWWGRWTGEIEG